MAIKLINADDILTSSGRYPSRKDAADATVRMNARITAAKLNLIIEELGYTKPLSITSGFRTPEANAAAGGAKKSLHMQGLAVDFAGQELGLAIRAHPEGAEILRKHGAFMEALEATKSPSGGWLHLDFGQRPDRPSREFRA